MKLELKHLASYLTYGLKVKHTTFYENGKTKTIIDDLQSLSKECASFEDWMDYYFYDPLDNECEVKPILFPLSEYYSEENGYGGYIAFRDFKYEVINKRISLKVYEDLLKNKFDVFGLIDAGLAEPVTENFNPYK